MGQKMNEDDELLGRLIQAELDCADRLSPEDALTERLKARIASENLDRHGVHPRLLRFISVGAGALALITGFVILRHALVAPGGALALSAYMARQMLEAPGDSPLLEEDNPYIQAWRQPRRSNGPDSGFRRLFEVKVSGSPESEVSRVLWPDGYRRKLGLDGTIRILFFDRSLQKCLIENAKKNGEV